MPQFKLEVRKIVKGTVEVEAEDEAAAWVAAEKLPDVAQVLGVVEEDKAPTPTNPFAHDPHL